MNLANRACLVTGGTRGIGRAVVKMFLDCGARVVLCGRSEDVVQKAVQELDAENPGKVNGKVADVRVQEQVTELFRFAEDFLGGLDVLVNNAGVGVFRAISELSIEDWRLAVDTNLTGAFLCSREAIRIFGGRGGSIVNISSLAGANAFAGGAAYNASKFGLNGFSEAMMQDLRGVGIRVSYVMPGSVATEFGHPGVSGASGRDLGLDWRIWPEDVAQVVRTIVEMPERTLVSRVEIRPSKPKK